MPASNDHAAPFTYRREIFWGDTDTAQIVYTGRFADFMLEAVESWMRAYLGTDWFKQTVDEGRGGPIVHLEIDFMSPLTPKDGLEVDVFIEDFGTAAITYLCAGYTSDRRLSFRGKLVTVGYSYRQGKKQPLTQDMRRILQDYQEACASPPGG
ncbi:MAG: acyl-CoA thioesterase [Hyphomicrobiales bacterium]